MSFLITVYIVIILFRVLIFLIKDVLPAVKSIYLACAFYIVKRKLKARGVWKEDNSQNQKMRLAYSRNFMVRYLRDVGPINETAWFLLAKMWKASDFNLMVFNQSYTDYWLYNMLKAVLYWKDKKAIRKLEDWEPDKVSTIVQFKTSLLAHLFETYEVAPMIRNIWSQWNDPFYQNYLQKYHKHDPKKLKVPENDIFDLYFDLANGASLRKTTLLPFKMGKKTAHVFNGISGNFNLITAYWQALFLTYGGTKENAALVPFHCFDLQNIIFWKQFMMLIARYPDELKTHVLIDLWSVLNLIKFGKGPLSYNNGLDKFKAIVPDFKLKGYNLNTLSKMINEKYALDYPEITGMKDNYTLKDKNGTSFQIVRLKNRSALLEEGIAMDHCVGNEEYHAECLDGDCSIWSLRKVENGITQSLITLQISGNTILEANGYSNAKPADYQCQMIEDWAAKRKLQVAEYYAEED